MKSTSLLITAGILLLFTAIMGCKKGSPTKTSVKISLVGKWRHTKTTYKNYHNNTLISNESTLLTDPNEYAEFKSDATGHAQKKAGSSYENNDFTYSVSNNILSMTDENNNTEQDSIATLSTTELILHSDKSYPNVGITYRDVIDIYFIKE